MSQLKQIDDRIWTITARYDDFSVTGVIIEGEERCLVWDTLARPEDMAQANRVIGEREAVAVISHADWDHCWGTSGIKNLGKIIAHESAVERFKLEAEKNLAAMRKKFPGMFDQVELMPPSETFSQGLSIYLGGINLEFRHLPGHTKDSIIAFVPERETLLMGDAVETPIPCVNADSPIGPWLDELIQWSTHPGVKTIIPAHGLIGGKEIIRSNVRYLKDIKKGKEPKTPENLDKFYQRMHRDNLKHAGAVNPLPGVE